MNALKSQEKNTQIRLVEDAKRRGFLKYSLFGALVVVSGKISKGLFNVTQASNKTSGIKKVAGFNIKESNKELSILDKDNNEILTIQNT